MPDSSVHWRLEGGYSRHIDRTRVDVTLEHGPTRQKLKLTPLGLFKDLTELILKARHGFTASGPGNLRWRLRPGGTIRAVVLQPGNAYLGNFRVPEGQFGIQWDVEGEVTSRLLKRFSRLLVSAETGTTLVHSWVTLLSSETTYLKVKSFLRWIQLWENGDQERLIESLDMGWEIPVFLWFHLLCPAEMRRSAVLLKGDLDRVWGDSEVVSNW